MSGMNTCLWYEGVAEEAAKFYVDIFKACGRKAELGKTLFYGENAPLPKGTLLTREFTLDGNVFIALNAGPEFKFTPAISLMILCDNQKELDAFWDALLKGGSTMACGWVTDRYGLSWQVTPYNLQDMLRDPDEAKASRAMQAMMQMIKLDFAALEKAYNG